MISFLLAEPFEHVGDWPRTLENANGRRAGTTYIGILSMPRFMAFEQIEDLGFVSIYETRFSHKYPPRFRFSFFYFAWLIRLGRDDNCLYIFYSVSYRESSPFF
jgi:hypothetical protein